MHLCFELSPILIRTTMHNAKPFIIKALEKLLLFSFKPLFFRRFTIEPSFFKLHHKPVFLAGLFEYPHCLLKTARIIYSNFNHYFFNTFLCAFFLLFTLFNERLLYYKFQNCKRLNSVGAFFPCPDPIETASSRKPPQPTKLGRLYYCGSW